MAALTWVDWALIAVLGLSVAIGLWRGLVYELLSLVGWVVAFVVAQGCSGALAAWVPFGTPGSPMRLLLAFGAAFVLTLIIWTLLAKLARAMISATPLSVVDRALGAGFGLARGVFVLTILALVITLTPMSRSPAWQSSHGAAWLEAVLNGLKPVLPVDFSRHREA